MQATLAGDLNAIRSQLRRLIKHVSPAGANWYDDPSTGLAGGIETVANKRMPAQLTTGDGQVACLVAVARAPAPGSYVGVRVNGVDVPDIGDGTRTGCACFFSADFGITARAWSEITVGDVLHWNGSIAGFELAPSDLIDFVYEEGG